MKTNNFPGSLCALCISAIALLYGCTFNVSRINSKVLGEASSVGLTKASIDMSNYPGDITVSGTSDTLIKATASVSELATDGASTSAADNLTVSIDKTDTVGSVGFSYSGNDAKWELLRFEEMSVDCDKNLAVFAKNTSGNINLSGIDGFVTLETKSGNVTADVVAGCSITVTSGNVDVTLKPDSIFANASIETTSGNIKVLVPTGFAADLDLQTKSGNIDTPDHDHSHLNGGDSTVVIKCRATSGNIRIEEN